ncbi:tyrosine-type recombinase/integrase [Nesterenkonia sp. F]|uniref:tyrosine-type recombinase/integrase n=1 Tax=Nesterenkonia sp. F TaxID=795955 RepID=UPI0003161DF3
MTSPGCWRTCRENGGWAFLGRLDGHLSPKRVSELLSEALGPHRTGHTLRHRFGTRVYSSSRDIRAVQELFGHASAVTTQRYTGLPDGAMRAAAQGAETPSPPPPRGDLRGCRRRGRGHQLPG